MNAFLFCFGYESPDEWLANERDKTDFESSYGVWVESVSEQEAIEKGLEFAQSWVAGLYRKAGISGFPGWRESKYAYWIEREPLEKWSESALESMPRR